MMAGYSRNTTTKPHRGKEDKTMTLSNERTIFFTFEYERHTKDGERVKVTNEGMLSLGMGTSFSAIQDFRTKFSKAYSKACKMVANGESWDVFSISVADYAWNQGATDCLDYHTEHFDSWNLSRAQEQGDPKEYGYLYAEANTKYTEAYRDMMVYSDIFKTLAEAGV